MIIALKMLIVKAFFEEKFTIYSKFNLTTISCVILSNSNEKAQEKIKNN